MANHFAQRSSGRPQPIFAVRHRVQPLGKSGGHSCEAVSEQENQNRRAVNGFLDGYIWKWPDLAESDRPKIRGAEIRLDVVSIHQYGDASNVAKYAQNIRNTLNQSGKESRNLGN